MRQWADFAQGAKKDGKRLKRSCVKPLHS
jgi:hypothetical protein